MASPPPSAGAELSDEERAILRVGASVRGKWTLDALIGVGGMAAVYAATHRNGQRAAIKMLHAELARDKVVGERFLREAYVSNRVGHPACVKVLDDDVTDAHEPFLVMELLEGETVRDAWKRAGRVMPPALVLRIVDPVLDCLAACHAASVIHRDLKPANVFVTTGGAVKVLDFGVAQMRTATAERTAAGTALGTPAYMSPEQAMGLVDQLDGRADVFSVGAMIHALVTGQRLNNGRTEQEALVMAATLPAASVARIAPHLPVELIALIDKALAWDRRNRFDGARDMQEAVRAVLAAIAPPRGREPTMSDAPRRASAQPVAASVRPVVASRPTPHVPESDPRVVLARDVFRQVDRVLASVAQLGWDHPATGRALRTAFEALAPKLAEVGPLRLTVRPYSLLAFEHTAWEPGPPFDGVPYHLFASGIRALTIAPHVTLEELRAVLAWMLLEPGRDLPPEDDHATVFWERQLARVTCELADAFADGDAEGREAFHASADEVEASARAAARAHASRLEAKAMALSTGDASQLGKGARVPMGLDDVVRAALSTQLALTREAWSERFVDALVLGYLDAASKKDAPLVLASLRRSATDLVVAGRLPVLLALHAATLERLEGRVARDDGARLGAALTNALFGGDALEITLKRLAQVPDDVPAFVPVLGALWAAELPTVLTALAQVPSGALRDALLRFVERALPGREMELAAAASALGPEVACTVVGMLGAAGSVDARRALAVLAASDEAALRIEAKVVLASPGAGDGAMPTQVQTELVALLENDSALVRMAAQRAIARHRVRPAWAAIARQVRGATFHELGVDERRELLRALVQLAPDRGEPIALEIVKRGGVFGSDDRETSRVLAAEALGAFGRSAGAVAALRDVAQARWGTSDETRAAAQAAAEAIAAREGAPTP